MAFNNNYNNSNDNDNGDDVYNYNDDDNDDHMSRLLWNWADKISTWLSRLSGQVWISTAANSNSLKMSITVISDWEESPI